MNNEAVQTNFVLDFVDNKLLSVFKAQVQAANIPAVTMMVANIPTTPKLPTTVAGSALEYDQMNISYLMDENYDAFIQLYRWMISIVNPTGPSTLPSGGGTPSIAILHLLNSNRTDQGIYIKFYDVFPSSLGSIDLAQNVSESERVVGNVTLNFKYFDVYVNGKVISPFPAQGGGKSATVDNRPIPNHPFNK
ncbi:baseplate wedge protein [Paraglaciecola Antarctic GD virus 1]|nr:baseplate wedge protein [Paraglaciecola Antarctic GD virus 1]